MRNEAHRPMMMRLAYMDVGQGCEQDAEASNSSTHPLPHSQRGEWERD